MGVRGRDLQLGLPAGATQQTSSPAPQQTSSSAPYDGISSVHSVSSASLLTEHAHVCTHTTNMEAFAHLQLAHICASAHPSLYTYLYTCRKRKRAREKNMHLCSGSHGPRPRQAHRRAGRTARAPPTRPTTPTHTRPPCSRSRAAPSPDYTYVPPLRAWLVSDCAGSGKFWQGKGMPYSTDTRVYGWH
jgi:hypothetical protein